MSMTNETNGHLNDELRSRKSLLEFIQNTEINELATLNYNWTENTIQAGSLAFKMLDENKYIERKGETYTLSRTGRLFLGRILIQFPEPKQDTFKLHDTYLPIKRLRVGKNSAIYLAEHRILGTKVIAKILRAGASENIIESLKLLSDLDNNSHIVRPSDFFQVSMVDYFGKPVELHCVVYPLVNGISLREFFSQESYHLNSHVAASFVRQVGSALENLERMGAYHGDLHDENILVEEHHDGQIQFSLIDVSFGAMGSLTAEECKNSDLSHFRQHLWRLLTLQKSFLPRMSLRKFLGTEQFTKIDKILSGQAASFKEVMHIANDESLGKTINEQSSRFIKEKFGQPTTFRLQRYEEIIDPSEAAKLFVPFPEFMSRVKDFSNIFVSGNRGSGKSTYLAALGFFPHSNDSHVDYRELFGIYFPCRQGEFKSLSGNSNWSDRELRSFTTQLVAIKIIRRTLETISSGQQFGKINSSQSYDQLRAYLNQFVPAPGIISVENDLLPELENFASTMVRIEMDLISGAQQPNPRFNHFLGYNVLIKFFQIISGTFAELKNTRFHVLFDDAGEPNLPTNVQRVLCDLILTSNPYFCIKFSAEKFTFRFESSSLKILENGNDYVEQDMSRMLFVGSNNARLQRKTLERYFRAIVEQRLRYFKYTSSDIVDYVGDDREIAEKLIQRLATRNQQKAYYHGWTAIWNIAERTPRNLLEIVSEIFAYGDIDQDSNVKRIKPSDQDKAIRTISHKRLQSLSQVPGHVSIGGKRVSLGRKLYEVTASIGSIFRTYLKDERGKRRKRQYLAIERNDLSELTTEANLMLEKLISFGILDDAKAEYARDDGILKPIFVLNRLYCPAFGIVFRRDNHLRLSRKKFELLLIDSESFVRDGTRRLISHHNTDTFDDGLFGFSLYE